MQHPHDPHIHPRVTGTQCDGIAGLDAKTLGQRLAHQNGVRFGDEGIQRFKGVLVFPGDFDLAEIIAEGRLGEWLHTQQAQRLVAQVHAPHILAHHRGNIAQPQVDAQGGIHISGQAGWPTRDLMRRSSGDALGTQVKRPTGGAVRQVDGNDHRHTERHTNDKQKALQEAPRNITPRQTEENDHHSSGGTQFNRVLGQTMKWGAMRLAAGQREPGLSVRLRLAQFALLLGGITQTFQGFQRGRPEFGIGRTRHHE